MFNFNSVEDVLPPMTPRMVREMKQRIAAHDFRPEVSSDTLRPIQATRSGLATVFFLSRFMHRQGTVLAALGAVLMAGATRLILSGRPASALCAEASAAICGIVGIRQRQTGLAAKNAAAQGLSAIALHKPPLWTENQMRAADRVVNSKTTALIMAYQPAGARWEDPYLIARRGYYLWKKDYFRRGDTPLERT